VFVGLVPWMFFANAVTAAGASLVGNPRLVSKICFPRVLIPLSAICALLVDLAINLVATAVLMLDVPVAAAGHTRVVVGVLGFQAPGAVDLGLVFAALNAHHRDVKYALPFLVQMGLFVTPVIYPLSQVPPRFQLAAALNP
jgi:homopolymeric O-antigen transport system permease protein